MAEGYEFPTSKPFTLFGRGFAMAEEQKVNRRIFLLADSRRQLKRDTQLSFLEKMTAQKKLFPIRIKSYRIDVSVLPSQKYLLHSTEIGSFK